MGVTLDFSHSGKPTDNAHIESFDGKFRAERQSPDRSSIEGSPTGF
jgi:transposase InsO family protein